MRAYVLPFGVLLGMLALAPVLPVPPQWAYPLRTAVVLAVLVAVSRQVIALRPGRPLSSVLVGVAVFAVWVGPELLFPGYRQHWLFRGALAGVQPVAMPGGALLNPWFLFFRIAGSALVVPVVEELFWRGWLMRRLIAPAFEKVPFGAYSAQAFWLTAVLFASEHGPYWDVGLAAGVAYNWWMLRTRSLADCILAHAVTNACLAAYVVGWHQWQYWL